jgi:hypothetical protein
MLSISITNSPSGGCAGGNKGKAGETAEVDRIPRIPSKPFTGRGADIVSVPSSIRVGIKPFRFAEYWPIRSAI